MTTTKYPDINIPLVGEDGNAFSILGRVSRVMRQNGLADEWEVFHAEATESDYGHLLRTVMAWFSVDSEDDEDDDDDDDYEDEDFRDDEDAEWDAVVRSLE